jgi:hypothetical protein
MVHKTCVFGHFINKKNKYNIEKTVGQIQTANRAHFTILQLNVLHTTSWRIQVLQLLHRMLVSSTVL